MSVGLALVCTHSLYCGISTVSLLNLTAETSAVVPGGAVTVVVVRCGRPVGGVMHVAGCVTVTVVWYIVWPVGAVGFRKFRIPCRSHRPSKHARTSAPFQNQRGAARAPSSSWGRGASGRGGRQDEHQGGQHGSQFWLIYKWTDLKSSDGNQRI